MTNKPLLIDQSVQRALVELMTQHPYLPNSAKTTPKSCPAVAQVEVPGPLCDNNIRLEEFPY